MWRWVIGIIGFLVAATIGLGILGSTEDPQTQGQSQNQSQGQSQNQSQNQSQGNRSSSGQGDPVVAACGPTTTIPSPDRELLIACTTTPPVIDGSFDEWADVNAVTVDSVVFPKTGDNASGVHGEARALWNRDALFVEADVVDGNIRDVSESQPDQFWRGDAVSFEFGPDARNLGRDAGVRNGRDRHVIIGISAGQALGAMNIAARGDFPPGGAVPEIDAKVVLTDGGYRIEARIPWSVLSVRDPTRGDVFAGNVNISDAKPDPERWALGVMVSSNPARTIQTRPAIWQSIVLGDPS